MKIKIQGVSDQLVIKEIKVLNQTFFGFSELVEEGEDLVCTFLVTESHGLASITVRMAGLEETMSRTLGVEAVKELKYLQLGAYAKILESYTKTRQSWGLMNGMRPVKIVHSLKKKGWADQDIRQFLQEEYLLSREKTDLLLQVAATQLQVVPDLYRLDREVSLYIGIPFCPTRCAYCTFAAYALEPFKKWVAPFVAALLEEVSLLGAYLKERQIPVTSIYLGGGTATALTASQLKELIEAIETHITPLAKVREVTVEAGRPDTIDEEKLALIKKFGIRRISINPQSFIQETLDRIGRHHSVEDVIDKYRLAKGMGIENINMDLIVGLPGEGCEELGYSLEEMGKLQPESLTVHMLAFKRKSKLTQERGLYTTASKEELQEMGRMTYDFAASHDYHPYYLYRQKNISGNMENIGYSKTGQESIYNILMMEEAQNVLGLGVGASSKYLMGTSVHNPRDIKTYIDRLEEYAEKKISLLGECLDQELKAFTKNDN